MGGRTNWKKRPFIWSKDAAKGSVLQYKPKKNETRDIAYSFITKIEQVSTGSKGDWKGYMKQLDITYVEPKKEVRIFHFRFATKEEAAVWLMIIQNEMSLMNVIKGDDSSSEEKRAGGATTTNLIDGNDVSSSDGDARRRLADRLQRGQNF